MIKEYSSKYKNSIRIICLCIMYINIYKLNLPFRVVTVSIHGKQEYQYFH